MAACRRRELDRDPAGYGLGLRAETGAADGDGGADPALADELVAEQSRFGVLSAQHSIAVGIGNAPR